MAKTTLKFLGHAAFSIETPGGKTVLLDPWIEGNPLSPIKVGDVRKADLILVTHDHMDHLGDAVEIARRTGGMVVGCPETVGRLQTELKLPAEQVPFGGFGMNIGGSVELKGIRVIMTEALHSSATANPCGYILKLEDGTTLYHAGDTGIFESMRLMGDLYKIDVALLPIGSCFTMDPVQAARALKLLDAKTVIPIHYRTFPFLVQEATEFVELAGKEAPGAKVVVLEPGQEHTLG